jgi:hypothetical protein
VSLIHHSQFGLRKYHELLQIEMIEVQLTLIAAAHFLSLTCSNERHIAIRYLSLPIGRSNPVRHRIVTRPAAIVRRAHRIDRRYQRAAPAISRSRMWPLTGRDPRTISSCTCPTLLDALYIFGIGDIVILVEKREAVPVEAA